MDHEAVLTLMGAFTLSISLGHAHALLVRLIFKMNDVSVVLRGPDRLCTVGIIFLLFGIWTTVFFDVIVVVVVLLSFLLEYDKILPGAVSTLIGFRFDQLSRRSDPTQPLLEEVLMLT